MYKKENMIVAGISTEQEYENLNDENEIKATFIRKHDGFDMGNKIYLGIDYSTGTPREDLPEYYEEKMED